MAVSIILDIIIALIAVLTIIISYKKGFLKSLIDTLSFFIAIVIALTFLTPVKNLIYKTALDEKILTETHSELDSAVGNSDIGEIIDKASDKEAEAEKHEDSDIIKSFEQFLKKFGIEIEDVKSEYDQLIAQGSENVRNGIIDYVAKPITNAVITVIAFLLLFIVSIIVIKIIAYVLNLATKLPVINGINKFLSIPLGVCLALFRIFCFCAIIKLILPYTGTLHISALNSAAIDSTFVFKYLFNNNILFKIF